MKYAFLDILYHSRVACDIQNPQCIINMLHGSFKYDVRAHASPCNGLAHLFNDERIG